jgi:hypothetical protein
MGQLGEAGLYVGLLLVAIVVGGLVGGPAVAIAVGFATLAVLTYVGLLRDQGKPSGTSLADAERDWNNARSQATTGGGAVNMVTAYLRLRRARRQP